MLDVGDREYRLSDMRKIGEQAEKQHGNALRPETPVGEAGLRYGHLLDPRIPILLESRKRFQFKTWPELIQILDNCWRYEGEGENVPHIPSALEKYYVPHRVTPFPITPQMRLEDLLKRLREVTGGYSDLITVAKEDVNWQVAATAPKRVDREAALQKLWGVCGATAQSLVERLVGLDGCPVTTYRRTFEGAEDAWLLEAFLKIPVSETVLIQICEPSVHHITIEKRPDGTAYLLQGYLSAYSALWWAGVKGSDRAPFLTATGTAATKLTEVRKVYGLGRPIPMNDFAGLLCQYLLADRHGPQSGKAWSKLPFHPGAVADDDRWVGNSIILEVDVIQLANESAARKALNDNGQNLPLTTLVMREAETMLNK